MSGVIFLSGISGLPFYSPFLSPFLFFCLVFFLFLSCRFLQYSIAEHVLLQVRLFSILFCMLLVK